MEEIDKVRQGEEHNYQVARVAVGDSASLVGETIDLYELLAGMVKESKVPPKDEIVAPSQFLLACRYNLAVGSLTTLRGHLNDSYYFCRKAIEACAFAYRISKNPHLAMEWLTSWREQPAYEKYRKKFTATQLFPNNHRLLSNLRSRYDLSCKMTHPSVVSFGRHIEVERDDSAFEFTFSYFQLRDDDPSEPIRTLIWHLDTHFGILQVFEEALEPVLAHDLAKWELRRNEVDARLGFHKRKWRDIILQT